MSVLWRICDSFLVVWRTDSRLLGEFGAREASTGLIKNARNELRVTVAPSTRTAEIFTVEERLLLILSTFQYGSTLSNISGSLTTSDRWNTADSYSPRNFLAMRCSCHFFSLASSSGSLSLGDEVLCKGGLRECEISPISQTEGVIFESKLWSNDFQISGGLKSHDSFLTSRSDTWQSPSCVRS